MSLAASWRRLRAVARKEVRQLVRDKLTLGFVVGVPAIQLLLFGYAINQDVRDVPTAVVDHASSNVSRWLVDQLEASQTFHVVARLDSEEEARSRLVAGEVRVAVILPPDFTRSYYRGRGAEISLLVDATDPTLARAVRASADGLMEQHNRRFQRFDVGLVDGTRRAAGRRGGFAAEPELVHRRFLQLSTLYFFNPELRTAMFVVPALLGVILTTTMILMTALAIVRERERGTFEFLIATPVSRMELLAGKILPYIGIGFVQVLIVLLTGLVLFRVPMVGRSIDLLIASLIFIAANLTLGLVISARSSSQFQATQMSFFFFLPSVLLSGFMFPFNAMPKPAQALGELLPLTHFIRLCRGILLRGTALGDQLADLLAMLLFTLVGFAVAMKLFSKRLD